MNRRAADAAIFSRYFTSLQFRCKTTRVWCVASLTSLIKCETATASAVITCDDHGDKLVVTVTCDCDEKERQESVPFKIHSLTPLASSSGSSSSGRVVAEYDSDAPAAAVAPLMAPVKPFAQRRTAAHTNARKTELFKNCEVCSQILNSCEPLQASCATSTRSTLLVPGTS